jgi:hypothetical protein
MSAAGAAAEPNIARKLLPNSRTPAGRKLAASQGQSGEKVPMHDRDLLENSANLPENWTGNGLGDA